MRNKVASIAAAAALAVGIAAPAPAMANPAIDSFVQSAQNSSQRFVEDPAGEAQGGFIMSATIPLLFSSLGSSMLGVEHCGPLSTQHC